MASNKMMLMILGKLNGQGAMPLAQISSSLKRNDRNTLRDLESMEKQGLVERVKADIKHHAAGIRWSGAQRHRGSFFAGCLKENDWECIFLLFPIAS
jgi:hypothetical protein